MSLANFLPVVSQYETPLHEQDMGNVNCEEAFQLCKSVYSSWKLDVLLLLEDFKRLDGQICRFVIWGSFWEPEEFVEAAMKLEHPYSVESALPKCLLDSIRDNAEWDDVEFSTPSSGANCCLVQACVRIECGMKPNSKVPWILLSLM